MQIFVNVVHNVVLFDCNLNVEIIINFDLILSGNKGTVQSSTVGAATLSPSHQGPTVLKHPPSYRPSSSASCLTRPDRPDSVLDADSSSTKSGRRPSVDTVSTYLSHESKDSELRASRVSDSNKPSNTLSLFNVFIFS